MKRGFYSLREGKKLSKIVSKVKYSQGECYQ